MENSRKKKRQKAKIIKRIILIILTIFIFFGGFVVYKLFSTHKKINAPLSRSDLRKKDEQVDMAKDPFSVLILGSDSPNLKNNGRADSIVVATVNPKLKSIILTSVPRDYRLILPDIPDAKNKSKYAGQYVKLNAAYVYGGIELMSKSVEQILEIPIDYYAVVNMAGFVTLIDLLGGVTIVNDYAFSDGGFNFPTGEITLNGEEALVFARMRKKDPNGDYGRQRRQRMIITEFIRKTNSVNALLKFNSILDTIGDNLRTNLTYADGLRMINLGLAEADIKSDFMQGKSKMIDKIAFEIVAEEERLRVVNQMKAHLERK